MRSAPSPRPVRGNHGAGTYRQRRNNDGAGRSYASEPARRAASAAAKAARREGVAGWAGTGESARGMALAVLTAVTGTGCAGDYAVGFATTAKALTSVRAFSSCLNYVSEGGLEPPFPAKGTSTSS